MLLTTLLQAALTAAAPIPQTAPVAIVAPNPPTMWAGHQVALGQRKVPVLGWLATRTDTYVLARMQRREGGWRLVQEACKVEFARVAGITISMATDALPETTLDLKQTDAGVLLATSTVQWGREDIDEDGHPGMTVGVDGAICSGALYVSNISKTEGTAHLAPRFLGGHVITRVKQSVLGAEGRCLQRMAKDTDEEVAGPFAYVPVEPDATCASLARAQWPVVALPK